MELGAEVRDMVAVVTVEYTPVLERVSPYRPAIGAFLPLIGKACSSSSDSERSATVRTNGSRRSGPVVTEGTILKVQSKAAGEVAAGVQVPDTATQRGTGRCSWCSARQSGSWWRWSLWNRLLY